MRLSAARPGVTAAQHRPASQPITARALGSSSLCSRQCGLLPLQRQQPGRPLPRPASRSSSLQCAASAAAALAAASFDSSGGGAGLPPLQRARSFPAFLAAIRAVFFYLTTFIFASPLFLCMLAVYPFVLLFDKYR